MDCMQRASFITSSMVWLARCKILVPLQLMGWSSATILLKLLRDAMLYSLTVKQATMNSSYLAIRSTNSTYMIAYVHTKSHSKRTILLTKGMAYIHMYVCTCMCISILVIHMHNVCVFREKINEWSLLRYITTPVLY